MEKLQQSGTAVRETRVCRGCSIEGTPETPRGTSEQHGIEGFKGFPEMGDHIFGTLSEVNFPSLDARDLDCRKKFQPPFPPPLNPSIRYCVL